MRRKSADGGKARDVEAGKRGGCRFVDAADREHGKNSARRQRLERRCAKSGRARMALRRINGSEERDIGPDRRGALKFFRAVAGRAEN